MLRAHLKVCCIQSPAEARLAIEHGASAIGLVAAMPSGPGSIADDVIAEIAAVAPPGIATFLLTSRTDPDAVVEHVLRSRVNTVQLVDTVLPGTYAALRRWAPGVRIVQVIHVQSEDSISEALAVQDEVDVLLLDSGRPAAAIRELGGTGRVHDWEHSARIVERVGKPVYLAGGIKPENVREAIERVRPYGIDLCSGVRTDGKLDAAKLGALVAVMR